MILHPLCLDILGWVDKSSNSVTVLHFHPSPSGEYLQMNSRGLVWDGYPSSKSIELRQPTEVEKCSLTHQIFSNIVFMKCKVNNNLNTDFFCRNPCSRRLSFSFSSFGEINSDFIIIFPHVVNNQCFFIASVQHMSIINYNLREIYPHNYQVLFRVTLL